MIGRGGSFFGDVRGRIGVAHPVAIRLSQLTPQSDSVFKAKTMRIRLMRPGCCHGERQQQPRQNSATSAGLARQASAALTR